MQKANDNHRVQHFIDACRQHQLKITPQRMAIYRALVDADQHPTADVMFQTIRNEYPSISFDTVNRTLLTFAAIGLVDVVEVFGGPKRFDPNVDDHHHLHCVVCGRIIDFDHKNYADLEVPAAIARRFTVISKRVVLKGLCETCAPERSSD
jgi:Fur family peroxide stress response transcriptional regulator